MTEGKLASTTGEIELSGRRAAVTGAGGFVGTAACRRLVAEGAEVVGLGVEPGLEARVAETGAAFAVCDITDPKATRAALEGVDLVVHAAALVREWGPMQDFIPVNVGGTANVLDAAEAGGAERPVYPHRVVDPKLPPQSLGIVVRQVLGVEEPPHLQAVDRGVPQPGARGEDGEGRWTGGDGSRQPSDNELAGARYQGRAIAETAKKLHG